MLRVTGEIVRYERTPWSMDGRTGVVRKARVLVGRADFVDVRFPDTLPEPREGDVVDLAVEATANVRNGSGYLTLTVRGDFAALVPAATPSPAPALAKS